MNYTKRAQEVIEMEMEGLEGVRDGLGKSFEAAVKLMLDSLAAGGKIVVTGIGKSLHIAQKVSATLASTGSTSVVLNPAQAMHGDLGILSGGDVLLVLSYSGESEELLGLIPIVKRLNVGSVAVTASAESSLGSLADIVIPVPVKREACPFNMAPTTSTTAALALGDALAMVLLEARGFNKEEYAKLHPGGAIGRALLLRVSDMMRTGDRFAVVHESDKVQDALVAMTKARAGSAGVVDKNGKALGIFTDGDLRRHLSADADLLEMSVKEVMTASPVTVKSDALAVDVLRVYEEHNIDDVLVVDGDGYLVGAVDIQDLPKLKIM